MSSFIGIYKDIDPDYIQKLESYQKHKFRKRIIFKYLFNCYFSNFKNIDDKKNLIMIKNTYSMLKFNLFLSTFFNFFLYKILFSSVFEYRGFYLNPGNIRFIFKLPISTGLSFFLVHRMWMNYCYNVDVYEMSVKPIKDTVSQ